MVNNQKAHFVIIGKPTYSWNSNYTSRKRSTPKRSSPNGNGNRKTRIHLEDNRWTLYGSSQLRPNVQIIKREVFLTLMASAIWRITNWIARSKWSWTNRRRCRSRCHNRRSTTTWSTISWRWQITPPSLRIWVLNQLFLYPHYRRTD